MSKLRSLNTAFWSDPWIENLEPINKLLFIYFITNEKTNMLGIYESSIKKISFETGISKVDVEKILKEFEVAGKVKYIHNHIILINYMKHQNYNPNMKKSAIDVYNSLPNELKSSKISISKEDHMKGFETLLNHYGIVPKVEDEVEGKSEVEVEGNFNADTPKVNPENIKIFTEVDFLDRWTKARMYFDKLPTHISKLTTSERVDFNELLKDYKKEDFDKAISGLFFQKTFSAIRVRPTHFLKLENFEKYLSCWITQTKLFEDKKADKRKTDML